MKSPLKYLAEALKQTALGDDIHPGITRIESPYERRGATATLDALHGRAIPRAPAVCDNAVDRHRRRFSRWPPSRCRAAFG